MRNIRLFSVIETAEFNTTQFTAREKISEFTFFCRSRFIADIGGSFNSGSAIYIVRRRSYLNKNVLIEKKPQEFFSKIFVFLPETPFFQTFSVERLSTEKIPIFPERYIYVFIEQILISQKDLIFSQNGCQFCAGWWIWLLSRCQLPRSNCLATEQLQLFQEKIFFECSLDTNFPEATLWLPSRYRFFQEHIFEHHRQIGNSPLWKQTLQTDILGYRSQWLVSTRKN